MPQPIEFYFDFSSPYGYFAATKIEALAAKYQRSTIWRPMLLGAVFKITGQQPLVTIPLKGSYAQHDLIRSARWFGVPFKLPSKFPVSSTAPGRSENTGPGTLPRLLRRRPRHIQSGSHRQCCRQTRPRQGSRDTGNQRSGSQGATEGRSRCRNRTRHLRFTVHHRRRRTVLGFGSAGPDRTVAGQGQVVKACYANAGVHTVTRSG